MADCPRRADPVNATFDHRIFNAEVTKSVSALDVLSRSLPPECRDLDLVEMEEALVAQLDPDEAGDGSAVELDHQGLMADDGKHITAAGRRPLLG